MAQNPALTQLLTALNAAPHPGMGNDFFAHVGSHLALARTVPPAWFPKTGTAHTKRDRGAQKPPFSLGNPDIASLNLRNP